MQPEIASAASHVTSLLTNKPPSTPTLQRFKTSLAESLQSRYSSKWSPTDPERGSATRALHWQPGPGGEGCSSPLVKLCDEFPEADFGNREWTVWVDPGCVAIREGPGPGRASSGTMTASTSAGAFPASPSVARGPATVNPKAAAPSPESIRVLYRGAQGRGAQPALQPPACNRGHSPLVPAVTGPTTMFRSPVPSSGSSLVPMVTVCPSTPAVSSPDATPLVPWTTGANGAFPLHSSALQSRRSSNATNSSGASSATTGSSNIFMNRNEGPSADTVSSVGTSIPAQSPGLPSEWSAFYSSDKAGRTERKAGAYEPTLDSYNMEAELQGLGLGDILLDGDVDVAPEDAIDERIEADESDERCNEGDDTILPMDSGDATLKELEPAVEEEPDEEGDDTSSNVILRRGHQSRPSTSSVTSFDNGNVGVLGGGIKLGGSSSSASSNKSRSRAHSTTSNGSSNSGHFGRQFQPSTQQQTQHLRGHSKSRSSINARTGGWAAQQQQQQYQHQYDQGGHAAHQQHQHMMSGPMNANFAGHRPYDMPGYHRGHSQGEAFFHGGPPPPQYQYGPPGAYQSMQQQPQQQPLVAPPLLRTTSAPDHQLPTIQYQPARLMPTQQHQQHAQLRHKRSLPFGASKQANNTAGQNLNLAGLPTPKMGSGNLALPSPALSTATSRSGGSYCSSGESFEGDAEDDGDDAEEDGDDDENAVPGGGASSTSGTKRTRTRGRRSRGRGTGRAARRAAAAATSPALPPLPSNSPLPVWSTGALAGPQQMRLPGPPHGLPSHRQEPVLRKRPSVASLPPQPYFPTQAAHPPPMHRPVEMSMYTRAW